MSTTTLLPALEAEATGDIEQVTLFRCKDGKRRKYRRTAKKEKQVAAEAMTLDAPALLSISTTSHERQVAAPTAELGEPTILALPTGESALTTFPMNPVAQSSFETHLAARMSAHGIEGTVSALMALLADLGVDVEKLMAAA